MGYFQKHFIVPRLPIVMLHAHVSTFNRKKIGKHRRSSLFICGFRSSQRRDGFWEIIVEFQTGRSAHIKVKDFRTGRGYKFVSYRQMDFRKLLRTLSNLQKQVAR